jgi:hypothetical protein
MTNANASTMSIGRDSKSDQKSISSPQSPSSGVFAAMELIVTAKKTPPQPGSGERSFQKMKRESVPLTAAAQNHLV